MLFEELEQKVLQLRKSSRCEVNTLTGVPYASIHLSSDRDVISVWLFNGTFNDYYTMFRVPEKNGSWPIQRDRPYKHVGEWNCRVTAEEFEAVLKEVFERLEADTWLLRHWQEGDKLLEAFIAKQVTFSELKEHIKMKEAHLFLNGGG